MGFLFQNLMKAKRISDERELERLQMAVKEAKSNLVREQIRSELIRWKKEFSYLSKTANYDMPDKEQYVEIAASDCIANITYQYSERTCYPEFCAGMRAIEKKLEEKMIELSPSYMFDPINYLQLLAYNGEIQKIIGYINNLEQTFTSKSD